jgi:hypothetical protein
MMRLRPVLVMSLVALLLASLAPLASATPAVTLSTTTLPFGNEQVGLPSQLQVTLTNTGDTNLNVTKIQITGNNAADFTQSNTCGTPPFSVTAGANCVFTVTFNPTWTGARSGLLNITDNATGSPQKVTLTGTGLAPAVKFAPTSLTFSGQLLTTTSASQAITLTNNGQEPLAFSSLTVAGANASEFTQTNTCVSPLAINASCTITVTFTPGTPWSRTGAIWLVDNALGSPHVVGLAGNGVSGGVASFSPTTLTFATRLIGSTSAPLPVTLSNTGTAPLQIANIVAAGDYAQTNNCVSPIAAGSNCTINVTFTPSYSASRPGWINVNFVDPAGIQTVGLTGAGALPNPVSVKPRASSITFSQTQQFTAFLSNVQTTNVTWSVDGVTGGNSTVGTISTTGLYTPPATGGTHKITAANNANLNQKATVPLVVSNYTGTLTHHNDTLRTGQNNNEPALTTGNVNKVQFGKLFSYPVDGQVYAEPLWVPNVTIAGQVHNVVFVATQHDSVYAFDADSATLNPAPLWQASFINPGSGITTIPRADVEKGLDISPEIGITSTPAIDTTLGTLFVEARTKVVSGSTTSYVHTLHALDITTGLDKVTPAVITAQVPGTGYDNVGGQVIFNSMRQNNRAGLLLLNGNVYIAFASLEDINPYHGWVLGYNETTLAQTVVFNLTPNGNKAGIWHGGGGIPADASGNLYVSTGTGSFDSTIGGGISFVKLASNGTTLTPVDYFAPYNQAYLNVEAINLDFSSSGPMLLPDQPGSVTHLAIAAGKTGTIYFMNRDNLGHFSATSDNVVQALYTTIGGAVVPTGNWGTPAYFNGQIYIQGVKDALKQFGVASSSPSGPVLLSGGPLAVGADIIGYPGTTPVISSNGLLNGIVWVVQADGAASNKAATLRAYDAANITHELWNSGLNGTKDLAGPAVKFAPPTVANGKVYVPTATELDVYGLQP